ACKNAKNGESWKPWRKIPDQSLRHLPGPVAISHRRSFPAFNHVPDGDQYLGDRRSSIGPIDRQGTSGTCRLVLPYIGTITKLSAPIRSAIVPHNSAEFEPIWSSIRSANP